MIVISGALVVVALVLLVIGLVIAGLGWVYGSIAVSLLSFVFLVIGILQRRKEAPATAETPALATTLARSTGSSVEPSTESVAVRTAPQVAAPSFSDDEATVTTLPTEAASQAASGKVLVVAGRPRYHVEGCRYLTGKDAESVDVSDARAEGFTACGVCKPDAALAAGTDSASAITSAFETPVSAEVPDGVVDAQVVEEPVRKAPARARTAAAAAPVKAAAKKAAPAKKAAAPAKKAAPVKKAAAPAKAAVKKAAPAKAAPAKAAAAKTTAKSTAAKAPAKKAPAKKAPAKRA